MKKRGIVTGRHYRRADALRTHKAGGERKQLQLLLSVSFSGDQQKGVNCLPSLPGSYRTVNAVHTRAAALTKNKISHPQHTG